MKALSDTLIANLTEIAEEACGTCTQIVSAVRPDRFGVRAPVVPGLSPPLALSPAILLPVALVSRDTCSRSHSLDDVSSGHRAQVDDAVQVVEDTLAKIDPAWQKDPLWKDIVAAIDTILGFVKVLCPSVANIASSQV